MIPPGLLASIKAVRHNYGVGVLSAAGAATMTAIAPSSAHSYWRVTGQTALGELELQSKFLGNKATGGTPTASSIYSGTYPASNAFDGFYYGDEGAGSSATPQWAGTGAAGTDWIGYQFASPIEINAVVISPGQAYSQAYSTFNVDYSDNGISWTTKWSNTGGGAFPDGRLIRVQDPSFVPSTYTGSPWGAHLYWRLMSLMATGGGTAGDGAAFLDHSGGTILSTGGTPSFPTLYNGSPSNLFSFTGNTTSYDTIGVCATYQFASAVAVGAFQWKASSGSLAQTPDSFAVQFSDNGTNWTTAWVVTGITWSSGQTQTFADPQYI